MSFGNPYRRRPPGLLLAAGLRNATGQDYSSYARAPTVGAGVTFTGGIADFDGSANAGISYPHTTSTETPPFSMAVWIKIDTYTGFRAIASDVTQSATAYEGWHWYIGPGLTRGLAFGQTDSSVYPVTNNYKQVWTAQGTLAAGSWYHVGVSLDSLGGTPLLYINAVAQSTSSSGAGTIASLGNSEALRLGGKGGPDFTSYFDGKMQDFRMVNRVWSAVEFAQIYAQTSGVYRP